MLTIRNLENKSKLFNGLDLAFPDAGLVFMCGKKESSLRQLIQYIGGFAYTDKLEIAIDGEIIQNDNMGDYRLKYMGYMSGNSQHIDGLTVYENVMTSSSLFYKSITDEYVDEVLNRCHLLEVKNELVGNLSELQLHYVDLARALMKDPKIIMANNPIARLNEEEQKELWSTLREVSKDHLVIVVNAIHGVAKTMADVLVSIEAVENNHVITNVIKVTEYNKLQEYTRTPQFEKVSKFDKKTIWNISNNLFWKAQLLIITLILGLSVFFVSMSATSKAHEKFAESLYNNDIKAVVLTRNTEKEDYSIPVEEQVRYENISSEIVIDWGFYFRYNVEKPGVFTAHLNNYSKAKAKELGEEFNAEQLYFQYPNAMFEVQDSAKESFVFVAGGWDNEATGIYISKSFAESYLGYYNYFAKKASLDTSAKTAFQDGFDTYGKLVYSSINDLVGKHLLFGYSNKFKDLVVAGIFEDNSYLDSIVFTSQYTFPQNEAGTRENLQSVYSIGIATLSSDYKVNAKFLNECASIIRNEKEFIYAATDLDYFYNPIYTNISKVPEVLNIISICFIVLVIAASAVLSYVQLSTYIKELALARTYGLKKPEIMRIGFMFFVKVISVSYVISIALSNIVCLIINALIHAKYGSLPFAMFTIPWQMYLIEFGICIILGIIFYVLARKMLQKRDLYLY